MSNQAKRLSERGGRRQPQTDYVEVTAWTDPINKVTFKPTQTLRTDGMPRASKYKVRVAH